jgi:hypothetical protein
LYNLVHADVVSRHQRRPGPDQDLTRAIPSLSAEDPPRVNDKHCCSKRVSLLQPAGSPVHPKGHHQGGFSSQAAISKQLRHGKTPQYTLTPTIPLPLISYIVLYTTSTETLDKEKKKDTEDSLEPFEILPQTHLPPHIFFPLRNTGYRIQDTGYGTRDTGHGTRHTELDKVS